MTVKLLTPSGGACILSPTNTASDTTITVPATTGTMALTADIPAAYTNSDVLTLFNASGSAPVYACRAWVNFNGTGTVAIRASGNVSSITDNGTGDYTVNFTTAMPDANYNGVGLTSTDSTNAGQMPCLWTLDSSQTTSAFRVRTGRASIPGIVLQGLADLVNINVSIFR